MVEGKVLIDMREERVQPEASGRVQSQERRNKLNMASRLDLTLRGEREGEREKEDKIERTAEMFGLYRMRNWERDTQELKEFRWEAAG